MFEELVDECLFSAPKNVKFRPKLCRNDDLLEKNKHNIDDLSTRCELVSIDKSYDNFCKMITPVSRTFEHGGKIRKRFHKVWWSQELCIKQKEVRKLLHDWLKRKTNENRHTYTLVHSVILIS